MKSTKTLLILGLFSTLTIAATTEQTKKKLDSVRTAFFAAKYDMSADYLTNWQYGRGQSRKPSSSQLGVSIVKSHLETQRNDIIAAVKRDLGNGKYKTGMTYRVVRETSLARSSLPLDFVFAIGGCYIASYADVKIGTKDSKGKIACKITLWSSTLTDTYKFDASDKYSLLGAGFEYDELASFARNGNATNFSIKSGSFYWSNLLGEFKI